MSLSYQAVGWNRQKKIYDFVLILGILLYLAVFTVFNAVFYPTVTFETILIRGFGTASLVLLHIILSIGPLCRLDRRFLPLLYNRRHLGVTMFLLGLAHGGFSIMQFHGFGNVNPLVSLFLSNGNYSSLSDFPFQPLGFFALIILFLMAATSHDFWLSNLTPPVWKGLHMLVYLAYGLVLAHVALGVLQSETSPVLAGLLGVGMVWVLAIHLVSGLRERDGAASAPDSGFVDVGSFHDIRENRAKVVFLSGERVAVFRYDGKISAISGICQHQNGPLGEGKVIDGCVTCPWHGYQYRPEDGCSPPPFTEKIPTFNVKLEGDRVLVDPVPNPPGTAVEPAVFSEDRKSESSVDLEARP